MILEEQNKALESKQRPKIVANLLTSMGQIDVSTYSGESDIADIMALVGRDLSEPYSIFTYRYFLDHWPQYCLLAHTTTSASNTTSSSKGKQGKSDSSAQPTLKLVGVILCKASLHKERMRGYIGMFAVDTPFRRCGIGRAIAALCVQIMSKDCDEIILETEVVNTGAIRLYEGLGFVRDKTLAKYYLNGNSAFRMRASFV
jgi:peptide alpha-N-acetyltransferase